MPVQVILFGTAMLSLPKEQSVGGRFKTANTTTANLSLRQDSQPTAFAVKGFIPYEQYATVDADNTRQGFGRGREKIAKFAFKDAVKAAQPDEFALDLSELFETVVKLTNKGITSQQIAAALDGDAPLVTRARRPHIDLLIDHNPKLRLASTEDKTLRLQDTEEGLYYYAKILPSRAADVLMLAHERGNVGGSSFGYQRNGETTVTRDADEQPETLVPLEARQTNTRLDGSDYVHGVDAQTKRPWTVLKRVDLREVSVLRFSPPAYKNATAQLAERSRKLTRRDALREYLNVVF